MKIASCIFIFFFLTSCARKNETREISDADIIDGLTLEGDSIRLPSFDIEISLSDKAEKKLSNANETIIVQAYLSGTPKDSVVSNLIDEMGEVNLGSSRVELNKPGNAHFEGAKISTKAYSILKEKDFQVLINVFSGRRSSESNLIECEILQETITNIKAKKHTLKGKLIGE
ncbi:MAG: hypothetical protein HOP08_15250 [Cyclobacteriaceae bacterium]|nr:hypothetical protein [Cyclobacteriaceae bacterium]